MKKGVVSELESLVVCLQPGKRLGPRGGTGGLSWLLGGWQQVQGVQVELGEGVHVLVAVASRGVVVVWAREGLRSGLKQDYLFE